MKTIEIKFLKSIFNDLKKYLLTDENERHAFLFCHLADNEEKIVFFPKKIILFDEDKISNSQTHFKASKEYLHDIFLEFLGSDNLGLISCHSHPFENGNVWFSSIDDRNDMNLMSYFYDEVVKIKENAHLLAMVFGQETIAARGLNQTKQVFNQVSQIIVMDEPVTYITPTNTKKNFSSVDIDLYNRQVLAFGNEGQEILSRLEVSLIGAGGTGSILAEALVRLGVRKLNIVDEDKLELTNLNRWQGGKLSDVGKYKVDILQENLSKMFEDVQVNTYKSDIFNKDILYVVKTSDVLIGAVDNHKTRYLLNKLSLQYLIPFLDCANGITSNQESNKIEKIGIRNSVIIPSVTSCLDCVDGRFYDKSDFRFDFVSAQTRKSLKQYNYIKTSEDIPSPSVYPMNMMSVSILLLEFMNVFMGYKPIYWNTYFNYLDFSNKETLFSRDTKNQQEKPSDSCFHCNDFIALGDSDDILSFQGK